MDSGEGTEPARWRAMTVSRPAHRERTVGSHSVISSSGNTSGMPPTRVLTTLEIEGEKKSYKSSKFKSLCYFFFGWSGKIGQTQFSLYFGLNLQITALTISFADIENTVIIFCYNTHKEKNMLGSPAAHSWLLPQ